MISSRVVGLKFHLLSVGIISIVDSFTGYAYLFLGFIVSFKQQNTVQHDEVIMSTKITKKIPVIAPKRR